MASDTTHEFNDSNFQSEVLDSDQPVLVDFWAEWCMPCRMLAPTIDELSKEYDGRVKVGKVDTDSNTETALRYQISAIPTVILFKNGEKVKQWQGVAKKEDFKEALDAH